MKEDIYQIATKCKYISDNQLRIEMRVGNGTVKYYCIGEIKQFEKELLKLCDLTQNKYPAISNTLRNHIIKYDNNVVNHQGAIDAIVDCILSLENHSTKTNRKIFISHSSADELIVKAFVKEILMLGCGFSSHDIFCTLDHTAIRTGDDFRDKIVENMKGCDFIICMISENYRNSEVCQNEIGAAWTLEDKRILPFKFPRIKFDQIGFLNVVKQAAEITDKSKLDELYNELCVFYNINQDWINFNQRKADFLGVVNAVLCVKSPDQ
ncbi:MAG: toll/interleukin-1 receptor domain-containing protein [Bacteroidaceae bacterium]|nr:toll/interleukin-1 receptor domain-containing protein [Bacteroidaceae bacterium]